MPHHLDPSTKKIVLLVTSFSTLVIISFMLAAVYLIIPKLRRRETSTQINSSKIIQQNSKNNKGLLVGCLLTLILMSLASTLLTLPIVSFVRLDDDDNNKASFEESIRSSSSSLSSSINFCEQDFRHSRYVAEPANVASSLGSYVPLALLGLFGRPSEQWRRRRRLHLRRHNGYDDDASGTRFATVWITLLSIGFGSAALHALLTSYAQGGDELPMLWYTASTSYCALDVIACDWYGGPSNKQDSRSSSSPWLRWAVTFSVVAATATYMVNRSDFTIFYILFSLYSQLNVVSILYIAFRFDWETRQPLGEQVGLYFRSRVLIPLAMASGALLIVAAWTWVLEMILCKAATRAEDPIFGEFGFFAWNRLVHPLWHFTSGLLAWVLAWLVMAAHGMQRGWGVPRIEWFGAPYIVFEPHDENVLRTASVSTKTQSKHVKQF